MTQIVATPITSIGLVFLPNALAPGSVHVLRLTATDSNGVGSADVTLPVASTPWGVGGATPVVTVSPSAGTALVTDFTVDTFGWDSNPSAGNLLYQVSYVVVGSPAAAVTVSTFKPQTRAANVTLPAGVAAGNFTVQLTVLAKVRTRHSLVTDWQHDAAQRGKHLGTHLRRLAGIPLFLLLSHSLW